MPNADYHLANGSTRGAQFRPGNPGGPGRAPKPKDTTETPQLIFKRRGFVPHELLVDACELMWTQLQDATLTRSERIKLIGIYMDTLLRSAEYVTPKLRAVEHSGQIDLLQRLQAVSQCTDEELVRLIADTEAYLAQQS